jgi:hypothetical protein
MLKEYKAYVDASGKGDPDILVIAGYIAPAAIWMEFSKEWQSRLSQARMPYFKMNEMTRRPEIAGWFYKVIEEQNVTAAISCVVRTAELVKVVSETSWPPFITNIKSIANPYNFAFKAIIDGLLQHQVKLGVLEPVDFIFDQESEIGPLREAWDLMKLSAGAEFRKLMGEKPIDLDDKKVMPLQAADLYAWWVRHWRINSVKDGIEQLKFPWPVSRDITRLDMEFGEKDFRAEIEKGLRPDALARARLSVPATAAALREAEKHESGITMTLPDPSSPWVWPV